MKCGNLDKLSADSDEFGNVVLIYNEGGNLYDANEVDEYLDKLKAENERLKKKMGDYHLMSDIRRAEIKELKRVMWLVRAERYRMKEFIAREEGNLCNLMAWSQYLRERTYNQWVGQLLRIANLANKLQNKCREKAKEYK